jgi:hypothetical protein
MAKEQWLRAARGSYNTNTRTLFSETKSLDDTCMKNTKGPPSAPVQWSSYTRFYVRTRPYQTSLLS